MGISRRRRIWFRPLKRGALAALCFAQTACGTLSDIGKEFVGGTPPAADEPGRITGFLGGVVADEPRAVLVAREVLSRGGNSADAAVALGFALSVTLPSRAALGAGGACLVYRPGRDGPGGGNPEAIVFTSIAPASPGPTSDRPAAVPMLARGLFALHARYGKRPFETLMSPAEALARFGVPTSRAFTTDLVRVAGPLLADPAARTVFGGAGGAPLVEGATMTQPDLGATLAALRVSGVGDLYQGQLARRLEAAARVAGGGLSAGDLRGALPHTTAPIVTRAGSDSIAFLPPPADGGLAAAAAFAVLEADPANVQAADARAQSVAAAWRARGGTPEAVLVAAAPPASLPMLPASTSFAVLDSDGQAVVCAISMNNLFGTGRVAAGTGILLAGSPATYTPPLLSAAIAWNANLRAFRAAVGGSGQSGAPLATAVAMLNTLRQQRPMPAPVPDPGRANVIACARYLPDSEETCGWATDPRGNGLAVGSN